MKLTLSLIVLCVIVFFLQLTGVFNGLEFTPAYVLEKPYTIITSIFMHSGFNHLFLNCLGIFTFGSLLEKIVKKKILLIFFASAFTASLGFALLSKSPFISAIGASGAVYGLIGCLAILKPRQIIFTPYGPLPVIVAAVGWAAASLILTFISTDNIAHSAHLFGIIAGVLIGINFLKGKDKYNYVILVIPLIALLFYGISAPKFPDVSINCSLTHESFDNYRYKIYECKNTIVKILIVPSKGFNLAESVNTIENLVQDGCKIENEKISEDNGNVIVSGICNKKFNATGKFENGVMTYKITYAKK